jgi:iron only hydrogenase large subunit-like protein/ferredoxin
MGQKVTFSIDGHKITEDSSKSVRKISLEQGIDISGMCSHPELKKGASCRTCVVKVKGQKGLISSCDLFPQENMEVVTNDEEIFEARKHNLELLAGQHKIECLECVLHTRCPLLDNFRKYKVSPKKFPNRKIDLPVTTFETIRLDHSKCIDCRNCVEVCPVDYLEVEGKGTKIQIVPTKDTTKKCIECGLCVDVCPVGALESVGEFEIIKNLEEELQNGKKLTMILSPVLVASIGEEVWVKLDDMNMDQLAWGIKSLGFGKVYNFGVAGDIYIIELANILKENLTFESTKKPLISSHCQSWVNYVKHYYPDLEKYLVDQKSQIQIILERIIDLGLTEEDSITVLATAETSQKSLAQSLPTNLQPNYILTTRELGHWLRTKKVSFDTLEKFVIDEPLANSSSMGDLMEVAGGLTEGVFRVLVQSITGEPFNPRASRTFEVGLENASERKIIKIADQEWKVVVANGIEEGKKYLDMLRQDSQAFDWLEVTVCPGGAVGEGGQPIPTSREIRQKRLIKLVKIDDTKEIRSSDLAYRKQ